MHGETITRKACVSMLALRVLKCLPPQCAYSQSNAGNKRSVQFPRNSSGASAAPEPDPSNPTYNELKGKTEQRHGMLTHGMVQGKTGGIGYQR